MLSYYLNLFMTPNGVLYILMLTIYYTMRKCTLRLDDELHSDVIEYCDKHGYKLIGLIRVLLRNEIYAEN